ncbi:transmembrane and coiled-coil domains protein 1-like isoform X2 [Oratosquilla oratoria]|uniref:transmembrane and coiled-coil domains protein 1-like isoform X2 n=1 Tax=Oratosquilla oratoria TaxID=337810 RepID=UPI003F7770AE
MDYAHAHAHLDHSSTPTSRPDHVLARGHARSRSRDASSDSAHHARDHSLGGTGGSGRRGGGGGGGGSGSGTIEDGSAAGGGSGGGGGGGGGGGSGMSHSNNNNSNGSNGNGVLPKGSVGPTSSSSRGSSPARTSSAYARSTPSGGAGASSSAASAPTAPSSAPPPSYTPPTLLRHAHNLSWEGAPRGKGSRASRLWRHRTVHGLIFTPTPTDTATPKDTPSVTPPITPMGRPKSQNLVEERPVLTRNFSFPLVRKKGSSSESSSVRAETALSSGVSNGSGELIETLTARLGVEPIGDENEPHTPNAFQRTREALDHLQAKIQKTKDLIKEEQKARDENVNEYLKLAANADRQQMTRIKTVFEKKNQKSAAYIQQLQKKLENYQKRQREIETHGVISAHRQPKEVLRDMGQGLKTVINKPKEIAHLIKNKFGSADNIKELASEDDRDEERTHHGSATLPPGTSLGSTFTSTTLHTSTNNPNTSTTTTTATYTSSHATTSTSYHHATNKIGSEEGSESNSSVTSESVPGAGSTTLGHLSSPRNNQQHMGSIDVGYYGLPTGMSLEQVVQEMYDRKEECGRLREEIETIKQTLTSEVKLLRECIGEERFKYERLEEQVNDLTELHQNEMENLKTTMTDMEEKVQYQSEERIRDLQEVLENCHTRISRMEHQQAQQQQYVTLEGLENSNARAIFVKLINVLLTILQVLLLVVATIANILTPLLQTRVRLITTATLLLFLIFLYVQWPEIRVLWERYRQFLPVN